MAVPPQVVCRALLGLPAIALLTLVVCHLVFPWVPPGPELACSKDGETESFITDPDGFHRSEFPDNFVFGSATSAYQVEGATSDGGKGPNIWDAFTQIPGKISDSTRANIAADSYHRYEEDIDALSSMHMDAYRFSIAWTRIFPDGRGPEVNQEGIAYYNRLIDAIIRRGIQPHATLHHWDLPQHLEVSIGGFLNPEIVGIFADYAEVCFAAFGDRVKHWLSFNEPGQFATRGYQDGSSAPGRTSDRTVSPVGNSSTEPYVAVHHQLLAHAAAVNVYRQKFQATQGGVIGIVVDGEWAVPFADTPKDIEAAERRLLFQFGWLLDPIFFGDYPAVMREKAGSRLPNFSEHKVARLRNSLDFIGINHYTTKWVIDTPISNPNDYDEDQCATTIAIRDGIQIGPQAYSSWLYMVPSGMQEVLVWLWERYEMPMYITENGMDTENTQTLYHPLPANATDDALRVHYYQGYLPEALAAIRRGVDLRGYFAWSLLDNFEWQSGYASRFGLFYIDFATLERYPKSSAKWFAKFLRRGSDICTVKGKGSIFASWRS